MSTGTTGILILIATFFISWIIVSAALWIAAKIIIARKHNFGTAMAGSFLSLFVLVLFSALIPIIGLIIGVILAILVLKYLYNVGFIHAIVLAVIALIMLLIISFILAVIGFAFPAFLGFVGSFPTRP
ncbi:MAG: hypothetical protein ACYDAZ_08400 [Thermoplasmataceae archaeon]